MGDVEIPDDFYITGNYLCYESCLFVDCRFTNDRNVFIELCTNINHAIDKLRSKCNLYDRIEETTYFVDGKFNNLKIYAYSDGKIAIYCNTYNEFGSLEEFLQFLHENYPECIKNVDIKIALKD